MPGLGSGTCQTPELEPVAERIVGIEPLDAWDRVVGVRFDALLTELSGKRGEILDGESGVRFARRDEILLDTHVQLERADPEPPAAARRELGRLRQLLEAEQPAVERARSVLATGRRRDLDVIEFHAGPRSTIDRVASAPGLQDSLVTGYRRLASDAPHRRIDFELRLLDIAVAVITGVVLLPLGLIIAAVVLITSGSPVLYRGERVGRHGVFFQMLKFRTLRRGAEQRIGQYLGEELVRQTEVELTSLGRWLKASQLDEIPQLWNVLRGDMSFVGPRPIRPRFFAELATDLPAYWQRLVVRPGLTGFAQVRRGYETSMAEKLAHDLEWIADRSVFLYLRTLVVTAFRVLRQSFSRPA